MRKLFYLTFLFIVGFSCSEKLNLKKKSQTLEQHFKDSKVYNQHFIGFTLYDPAKKKTLYSINEDKYFTPASNTKLLTLLTSKKEIGDSIPGLKYRTSNDTLYFKGTGDPSLLHPEISSNKRIYDYLKNQDKTLVYIPQDVKHFGNGWSWDDYYYKISTENSAMPIFGNYIQFKTKDSIHSNIPYFDQKTVISPKAGKKIERELKRNIYHFTKETLNSNDSRKIPFIYNDSLFIKILSDTLQKTILLSKNNYIKDSNEYKVKYASRADSIYKLMMQKSDNFIAEQLLLTCSEKVFGRMSANEIIKYSTEKYLKELPDKVIWKDGSGLSRYNLNTPRNLIKIYELLEDEFGRDKLMKILSSSGENGTLSSFLEHKKGVVVGKTGTLSNNYGISGYIKNKKGKWYLFSFINNNYTIPSIELKNEMEKTLEWIHNHL